METWLGSAPYLVNGALSLADVALIPYTGAAPEGGFDLKPFPAVRDWIARVETDLVLAH